MAKQIIVRPYQSSDRLQVGTLFYDTVHTINLRDYTEEQLDVWAPAISKEGQFTRPLEKSYSYIAAIDGQIVGFADITSEGCLDRLYVHKNFQRQKIASKLVEALEAKARELSLSEITTESSITAKPFFIANGYTVKEENKKILRGATFINYKMFKKIA